MTASTCSEKSKLWAGILCSSSGEDRRPISTVSEFNAHLLCIATTAEDQRPKTLGQERQKGRQQRKERKRKDGGRDRSGDENREVGTRETRNDRCLVKPPPAERRLGFFSGAAGELPFTSVIGAGLPLATRGILQRFRVPDGADYWHMTSKNSFVLSWCAWEVIIVAQAY
ncbi:uncharacterized protein LOC133930867 isoform X1 [Phragmites australis]|uniref:uncharacterized protein LOC133930867 isoform X1 n=1 Tax=Phragmites australis TaxID=29695 RepID=UPI002D7876BF|nr:uncharacterized protein LOC133930867 isoform X1 [Phragmites australis]